MNAHPFAIAGVRVWDGVCDRVDPSPSHIRIERGRIAAIAPDPALLTGATIWRVGPNAVAIPGLIDAHVHLTLDPAIPSVSDQLSIDPEIVADRSERRAEEMVRAGITTARDLGGGRWLEIAIRDRIDRGELPGPRLLCAGQPLTPTGGHCHFWGGVVSEQTPVRGVIDRQVAHGVDWIKVMATGGVNTKGYSVREAQFDAAALTGIREAADAAGLRVAAHCHGTDGIRHAAAASVASIEHCSFAGKQGFGDDFDSAVPDAIRAAGTWVSPTVNAGWQRFIAKDGEPTRFFRDVRVYLAALRAAGVPLIASTDAGIPNVRHHDLARALVVFALYTDFTPVEVLRSATSHSALALGLGDETGVLRPGLSADVLVVNGDPTDDLEHLHAPALVVARGRQLPEIS